MIIGIMVKKLRMAEYSVDIARFPKMGIELTEGSWRGALVRLESVLIIKLADYTQFLIFCF